MESGKNDAEERSARTGAEVVGSFDEIARNVFEGSVQREKNERRVDVRESEDDRERAIEKKTDGSAGDVEVLQEAVEDAVGAENGFPGVAADEIADPERDDDKLIEKIFANARVEGHEVGERIAEQEREQRDAGGDASSAEKNFGVDGIMEELGIVLEIPLVDDDAVANEPEAVGEHEGVREKKEKRDPEKGRGGDDGFVGARVHG